MSSLGSPSTLFLAKKGAYEVDRSLRINSDDSAYLRKSDFGSPDSSTTFTFSAWIKRTTIDAWSIIAGSHSGSNAFNVFGVNPQNELVWRIRNSSGTDLTRLESENLLRDPSAWYHVLLERNSTLSSSSDRAKLYINGVRVTEFDQENKDEQDRTYTSDFLQDINIGRFQGNTSTINYGDMYLAEFYYIDGQAYDPSYFTETDLITGQLIPKKYTGGYGSNGFYLNFSDNSGTTATTLGKDSSGNGNNFTPNNFSVAAGEGNDSLEDSPTNNFCTINPLDTYRTGNTVSDGNLKLQRTGSNFGNARGSFAVNSGKWYYEWKCLGTGNQVGWVNTGFDINYNSGDVAVTSSGSNGVGMYLDSRGIMYGWQDSGGNTYFPSTSSYVNYTTGDIIMVAFDIDNFKFWFGKNGSWTNVTGTADPSSGTDGVSPVASRNDGTYVSGMFFQPLLSCWSNGSGYVNFGQRPFSYTIPTGYQTLCSPNLSDPAILLPNKHFAAFTYTGTGSSGDVVNITNSDVDFTPDWVWVKTRNVTNDHILSDAVRGGNKYLVSSEVYAEQTDTDKIRAFIQNGFESGTDGDTNWSGGRPFVAWNWNAGTDGKTYTVKVVSDSGNKYRFDDFGTSAVTLDLAEGGTYTFDQSDSSMSSHPMQLSTTANGTHGGGSAYSTGVTYQLDGSTVTASAFISGFSSASSRKLIITVAASAPTLYYYCYYHSGMGGQVNTNSTLGSSNFDGSRQVTTKANASAGFSIIKFTGTGSTATIGHGLGVAPEAIFVKTRSTGDHWAVYHHELGNTKIIYLNLTNTPATSSAYWNNTSPTSSVFTVGSDNKTNKNSDNYIAYCFSGVSQYSKFGLYQGNGNSDGTFVFTGFRPALLIIKRTDSAVNWVIWDNKRDTFNAVQTFQYPNSSAVEGTGTDRVDFVSNGFKWRDTNAKWNNGTFVYFAWAESPFKNARAR